MGVKVAGSGRIAVDASAAYCRGFPKMKIWVDGRLDRELFLKSRSARTYYTKKKYEPGKHRVLVVMRGDWSVRNKRGRIVCDRRVRVLRIAPTVAMSAKEVAPPSPAPTSAPTAPATVPTPTTTPTTAPTTTPTTAPTTTPTSVPTTAPTSVPTTAPTTVPTTAPTSAPTSAPPTGGGVDPRTTFTLAIIGDTQGEVTGANVESFPNRMKQIAQQKSDRNIQFAIQTGDVTNWGWLDYGKAQSQFAVAQRAMGELTKVGIPFQISNGNHDNRVVGWGGSGTGYGGGPYQDNPECLTRFVGVPTGAAAYCKSWILVRETQEFNQAFPPTSYAALGGTYQDTATYADGTARVSSTENSYSTFTAANRKWLVLNLELWPRPEVVAWAQQVVSSHPDHNVLVQTHHYLNGDGSVATRNDGYVPSAQTPNYLMDNLISKYPNIKMVFSGHTGQTAQRTDAWGENKVVSYLGNGSGPYGITRFVTIDTAAGTASSQWWGSASIDGAPRVGATVSGLDFE